MVENLSLFISCRAPLLPRETFLHTTIAPSKDSALMNSYCCCWSSKTSKIFLLQNFIFHEFQIKSMLLMIMTAKGISRTFWSFSCSLKIYQKNFVRIDNFFLIKEGKKLIKVGRNSNLIEFLCPIFIVEWKMRELFTGVPWSVRFAYKKSIKHLSREDMIGAYWERRRKKIHRKNHRCRHESAIYLWHKALRGGS